MPNFDYSGCEPGWADESLGSPARRAVSTMAIPGAGFVATALRQDASSEAAVSAGLHWKILIRIIKRCIIKYIIIE